MLTLCASPGACSQISIIMLEKAQVNYALRAVHLAKGEHKTTEYLSVNPKGKVPALLTDTGVITETSAILLFLHGQFQHAGILSSQISTVEAVSDLSWFTSTIHPLITRYCKPELLGVSHDVTAVKANAEKQLLAAYRSIEERLSTQPFWYGNSGDALDIYLFWTVNRLKRAGFSFAYADTVIQHYQRLLSDPVIKRALNKERAL